MWNCIYSCLRWVSPMKNTSAAIKRAAQHVVRAKLPNKSVRVLSENCFIQTIVQKPNLLKGKNTWHQKAEQVPEPTFESLDLSEENWSVCRHLPWPYDPGLSAQTWSSVQPKVVVSLQIDATHCSATDGKSWKVTPFEKHTQNAHHPSRHPHRVLPPSGHRVWTS